jgi:hypothetical protein
MSVMGVTCGAAAGRAVLGAGAVACGPGLADVLVQACVAARVRLTSATATALDLRRQLNIYDAT